MDGQFSRVVQMGTLTAFWEQAGIPSKPGAVIVCEPVLYLMLSESWAKGDLPRKDVSLDLFGLNKGQEIVWLHYSYQVMWGQNEPAFERDASIYEGLQKMLALVKGYLEGLGYRVRPGRYAVPDSIKPMRGNFECVRWVKDGESSFRVETVGDWSEVDGQGECDTVGGDLRVGA